MAEHEGWAATQVAGSTGEDDSRSTANDVPGGAPFSYLGSRRQGVQRAYREEHACR